MNVLYRKAEDKTLVAANCDSIWYDCKESVVYIQLYSHENICRRTAMPITEYEEIIQRGALYGSYNFSGYLFYRGSITSYAVGKMFR